MADRPHPSPFRVNAQTRNPLTSWMEVEKCAQIAATGEGMSSYFLEQLGLDIRDMVSWRG